MEQCFLCGKVGPVRRVEIEVASSVSSSSNHGHDHHSHGGSTRFYELKPLCEQCITERAEAAKAALKLGAVAFGGMSLLMVIGCLAPFLLFAVGGALLYFFGHH